MQAIILAAGIGQRLGPHGDIPKCLLNIGGRTLLDRHLACLKGRGVTEISLCVGYERQRIEEHIKRNKYTSVRFITNDDYREGSMMSLWATRETLRTGGDIILMDADVLYADAVMRILLQSPVTDRLLCDRNFEAGDEPVKVCLQDERIVDFRKRIPAQLTYNDCGESVGFFAFSAAMAAQLAGITEKYISDGHRNEPYEEAVRDLLLRYPGKFEVADVTGVPWIEIDFPDDIKRAEETILPQINDYEN